MIYQHSPALGLGGLTSQQHHFDEFTLDQSRYRLQRGERILRLEKRPMELLILLVERRGELVSREEIAQRLWGKDIFLDVDRSINTAISKVRVALRDDPDKARFVETVIGKGYRFAAAVVSSNGDSPVPTAPAPDLPSPSAAPSAERRSFPVTRLLVGMAVLAVLGIAVLLLRHHGSWKSANQPTIKSVAVLPLRNLSGDPSQEYLADGMTEALVGKLSLIRGLRVISRTSVMGFKETHLSVPEIARTLHVDAIVEGSVIRENDRIRIYAQLIRGDTDEHFWSETYDRELRDALSLQSEVAQSIAQKVAVTVTGGERVRLVAARHVAPEVFESYLKGQFVQGSDRGKVEERIAYFEEAIRKDPTFAPAYVGLGSAHRDLSSIFIGAPLEGERREVARAAQRALELDPNLAEAHVLLADMKQRQWRWGEAEAEYKRALDLKPNDASAHLGLANWLMCQGRMDEALDRAHHGRELDPLGTSAASVAWILFQARRYDEAIREERSQLEVHPDDAWAMWGLGFTLIAKGKPEEAIPVLEKTASIMHASPGSLELLATAYARAGRRVDALRLIRELEQRREKGYVPAGAFINPYIGLGDYEQAFVGFEHAYREQSSILQFIKVHPFFDPLRDDPRFKDLLRRVGLAEKSQ